APAVARERGLLTVACVAAKQPGNAARRNVDLVLLTSDEKDIQNRLKNENYLPLDGLLTQEGDVFLKVHGNATVTVNNGTEHSPYWVHLRKWKPKTIKAKADWEEVGSLLDTLNDGQWAITANGTCGLEFGVRNAAGTIESIAH